MSTTPNTQSLSVNGLTGRVLTLPGPRSQTHQILLIYGIHSSLERMQSTAEFLSAYGDVAMPDLPGIGGMDSFYKACLKPTLDNYADYLRDYLRSAKLAGPISVVAMSFGFLVITRMLQKYPELRPEFGPIISFVGFGRASDFKHHKRKRMLFWPLCAPLSTRIGGWLVEKLIFNRWTLKLMFRVFKLFNPKYKHGMATNPEGSLKMELDLWQKNDARTRFYLYLMLSGFDLTKHGRIDKPLHNMTTPSDQYFEEPKVIASLKLLYDRLEQSTANMGLHAPSIIGNTKEVSTIFSDEVKDVLKRGRV